MSSILDPSADRQSDAVVIPFPVTCREYLGRDWGFCPGRPVTNIDGHPFCEFHLKERERYRAGIGSGA